MTVVRTVTTTVTKVTVEILTDQDIPLPDILVQADAATMAAVAAMQSDSDDESDDTVDTSILSPASPDPPERFLDALRALPRMNSIDLFFPPVATAAAGAPTQPAAAMASSTANVATASSSANTASSSAILTAGSSTVNANANAGPSSGRTNARQRPTDARTRVVRGRRRQLRSSECSDFFIRRRRIPTNQYEADIDGPFGPRPRNVQQIDAMEL